MSKLTAKQLREALLECPDWDRKGKSIVRTYAFEDFPQAIRFVQRVARVAEKAWHHPDIQISWNRVTLTLSTHDEGGLTGQDVHMARQCDRLATKK